MLFLHFPHLLTWQHHSLGLPNCPICHIRHFRSASNTRIRAALRMQPCGMQSMRTIRSKPCQPTCRGEHTMVGEACRRLTRLNRISHQLRNESSWIFSISLLNKASHSLTKALRPWQPCYGRLVSEITAMHLAKTGSISSWITIAQSCRPIGANPLIPSKLEL